MPLKHHIFILVVTIIICLLLYLADLQNNRKHKIKVTTPIGAAIVLFVIFEIFYWGLILIS